jgi:hypothetical protein
LIGRINRATIEVMRPERYPNEIDKTPQVKATSQGADSPYYPLILALLEQAEYELREEAKARKEGRA